MPTRLSELGLVEVERGRFRLTLADGGVIDAITHGQPDVTAFETRPATIALSRFAACRRDGDELVLESPVTNVSLRTKDAAVIAFVLSFAVQYNDAVGALLCVADRERIVRLLLALGYLLDATNAEPDPDVARWGAAIRYWEHHDLAFHVHSRLGRRAGGYGGTFRFGKGNPPSTAQPASGPEIELPRPDLAALERSDRPFIQVMESRVSTREFTGMLTIAQLGEVLFRALAVRHGRLVVAHAAVERRPYPSGGAVYPLRFYLVVDRCDGLTPGLYVYDPNRHSLSLVRDYDAQVARMVEDAHSAMGRLGRPQALMVIAASFPEVFWKYSRVGYALILKDLGVVIQNLYLAAEAAGVGACALGGGDSDLFARCASAPYYELGSVGEFALGGAKPR